MMRLLHALLLAAVVFLGPAGGTATSTDAPSFATEVGNLVSAAGYTYLVIGFEAAASPLASCTFAGWRLEWREWDSTGSWTADSDCASASRSVGSCNVTGLSAETGYDFRLAEMCSDSSFDSDYAYTDYPIWTRLGARFAIGTSAVMTVTVDIGAPADAPCYVIKECCSDQFTVCTDGTTATISRADVAGGWGQEIELWCPQHTLAHLDLTAADESQLPTAEAAGVPAVLELRDAGQTSLVAYFAGAGKNVGTCGCVGLQLELCAFEELAGCQNGSATWRNATDSDCLDPASGSCTVTDLEGTNVQPDSVYWARARIVCDDSALDSDYAYSASIITYPACDFSTHSGYEDEFECQDGYFCDVLDWNEDLNVTDDACCADHGGVKRCSRSEPIMCRDPHDCAYGTDHCCRTDCIQHSGPLECKVPAKAPTITSVLSPEPGVLEITWEAGNYYLEGESSCVFVLWYVEVAQEFSWGLGDWISIPSCFHTSRSVTFCRAEGLDTNAHYAVQVREHCSDGDVDSSAFYYDPVMTLPVPAEQTTVPDCREFTYFSFLVSWSAPDNLNDCSLTGYELEAQLQGRTARYTDEGFFEEAAEGWDDYQLIATVASDVREVTMTGLLSNREYRLRVRTLCEVADSQSDWSIRTSPCLTLKAPAEAPSEVEVEDITRYTFLVDWEAGDPLGCVFFRWEVQVMKDNYTDWPVDYDQNFQCENQIRVENDPCTPDFECFIYDRDQTNCSMDVGRGRSESGNVYQVRVREACTEFDVYSPWEELDADDLPVTVSAIPGTSPTNFVFTSSSPTHTDDVASVEITWTAGTVNDCEFDYWLVEFSPSSETGSTKTWTSSTQCAQVARADQACTIDSTGVLDTNTIYDFRVREVCIDASAMAAYTEVSVAVHTRPLPARIPTSLTVTAASAFSLRLEFNRGKQRECAFYSWSVEWIEQGTSDVYTFDCTESRTDYCVVTGLPSSYTFYSVRIQENCTDSRANSEWTNFSDYVQTWPDPAEPPTVTLTNLEAYTLTLAITPGDPLDCVWSAWSVYMRLAYRAAFGLHSGWYKITECDTQLLARTDLSCVITGLESFTDYDLRVREECTNYIYDSDWGYVDAYTTLPIAAGAPTGFTLVTDSLKAFFFDMEWTAGDAGQCVFDGWLLQARISGDETWQNHTCNEERNTGSTVTCRVDWLQMGVTYEVQVQETCTDPLANSDWSVYGSTVTTIVVSVPPTAPSQLVVSEETAYTFTVTFQPGNANDCYFSGWDVQVRENGTTNETLPDNVTSEWVSREECKDLDYAPRDSGDGSASCVVPRLLSESNYDVRVRETCYNPYIYWLDGPYNEDEPDREALTTETTAGLSPSDITASNVGPYYFTVQWTPGIANDCVFAYWQVELLSTGSSTWTSGEYLEATECRDVDRATAGCNITQVPGLSPGHLASDTTYAVRVQEVCGTYLSIYDPAGKEHAPHLQAPFAYMAAADYPQTTVPVAAEAPTGVTITAQSAEGFSLSWTSAAANECRFSAWEVSYKQISKCVAGYGFVICTAVADSDWELGCLLAERGTTQCSVVVPDSYSYYDVEVTETCTDSTANSPAGTVQVEVYAARAEPPINLTATSTDPFELDLEWELANPGECVFMYWDVQVRPRRVGTVENRWYGEIVDLNDTDLEDWSDSVPECFNNQTRDEANCTIPDLVSNAIYDVRIAERCNDSRADSDWTYLYEAFTIPAWALAPVLEFVGNETQETFYFEWSPSDARDCLFRQWYVAVRPSVVDHWIEVPECGWDTREDINNCTVLGLQTKTTYDLLVRELCIHESADGANLTVDDAATTDAGYTISVGRYTDANILTIANPLGYDTCAIEDNCCIDEFALCYSSSTQSFDVIRMDLPDAGWGQELQISCIKSSFPAEERKLLPAQPPENMEAVVRAPNSTTIAWTAAGNRLYISDCHCTTWTIQVRLRDEETEWHDVEECTDLSANVSKCLANSANSNWLQPDSFYEVRLRQTCSNDWLNSDYSIITIATLPGCDFAQHSGRDGQYLCHSGDYVEDFEQGGAACVVNGFGGIRRCPRDRPFMCESQSECPGPDVCCSSTPCGTYAGGDRVCIVRPYAPENIIGTSATTDSMTISWSAKDFADMDYYPCNFKEWRIELARYWSEDDIAGYIPQYTCNELPRSTTSCTVDGLVHNGDYLIRVMEICYEEDLNGDYGYSETIFSVLPIRAETPPDFQVAEYKYTSLDLSWSAGEPEDCVFDHWEVAYTAVGSSTRLTATVSDRETTQLTLTDLVQGTQYVLELKERCTEQDADSIAAVLTVSTLRLWIQPDTPTSVTISEVTPYSLLLTWEPGAQSNDCEFAYWEITLQEAGASTNVSVPLCRELTREESACNLTETFACTQDYNYAAFLSGPCVADVDCPITDVDSVDDCIALCSQNQSCRALNYRAAERSCYLRDTSEILVPEDPIHQTTACGRTVGLTSNTTYSVSLYEHCQDAEANGNVTTLTEGTTTAGAPATAPILLTATVIDLYSFTATFTPGPRRDCVFMRDDWPCIQIPFSNGDTVDCTFAGWGFEFRVNESDVWQPVSSVTCSDEGRQPDYCTVVGLESGESQEIRMREECTDPALNGPFQLDYLWVTTEVAVEALAPVSINATAIRIGADVTNCASQTLNPNGCSDMQSNTSIEFAWDTGTLNDCSVSYWLLQLKVSTDSDDEWFAIDACRSATDWASSLGMAEGFAYCIAAENENSPVVMSTIYDVRVRAVCADEKADGDFLVKAEAVETLGELTRAGLPSDFSVSNVSDAALVVTFTAGAANDCQSQGWQLAYCKVATSVVPEASSLHPCITAWNSSSCTRSSVDSEQTCTLNGLEANATYQVTVQEVCADTALNSAIAALVVSTSDEQDIEEPASCPFLLDICNRTETSSCSSHSTSSSCTLYWELVAVAATTTGSSGGDTFVYVPATEVSAAETCDGSATTWGESGTVQSSVATLEDCQALCDSTTDCAYLQYLSDLEDCHLYQDCSTQRSCTSSCGRTLAQQTLAEYNTYTYVYVATEQDETNTTCDGSATTWGSTGVESTTTLADCKTACTDSADCNYLQFELDAASSDGSGTCHLYQDCLETQTCQGSCGRVLLKQVFTGGPVLCGWDDVAGSCTTDHSAAEGMCGWTLEEVEAECEVTTVILTGLLAVNYVSRRLVEATGCLNDALQQSIRQALATIAQVSTEAVAVEEDAASEAGNCLLRYTLAVATVAASSDDSAAQAEAETVLGRLSPDADSEDEDSDTSSSSVLSRGVTEWLQRDLNTNITIEEAGSAAVDVHNDNLLRVCGAPPAIRWMDMSWNPRDCADYTRASGPCYVPCQHGYHSEGHFTCTPSGAWTGTAQCLPQWTPEPWSPCSNGCGLGVQERSVSCPISGACTGTPPITSQECFGTEECSWLSGDWSDCSTSCGVGNRSRSVVCSSSRTSEDCQLSRPTAVEECEDYSTCGWSVGSWGQCTSSCGDGTQSREVTCISWSGTSGAEGEEVGCAGDAPAAVQRCHNSSLCEWQTGDWLTCSNACGSGVQTRHVWCPSGIDEDCPTSKPSSSQNCRGTTSCTWSVGDWLLCGATCGSGWQHRSVACVSGIESDCPAETRPSTMQSCYSRESCSWVAGAWSQCSNQCGSGIQERQVTCPTGVADDCGDALPEAQRECISTALCGWQVSQWGSCSSSCGVGERARTVTCPSGNESHCLQAAEKPANTEACHNRTSCSWQVFEWSACSESCGIGEATRTVSCPSGVDDDCPANDRPASSVNCQDTSGCGWSIGDWSSCNTTCGHGVQMREATCIANNGTGCTGASPAVVQTCYSSEDCEWLVEDWSACSSSCGAGLRSRRVECPSGVSADCGTNQPPTEEICYSTEDCSWIVSEWGACTGECGSGTRARSVQCPSGHNADCEAIATAPDVIEECESLAGCSWQVSDWSECTASCGSGEQHRSVFCASSEEANCPLEQPAVSRACHATSGCQWVVGGWTPCSTQCGRGTRSRSVHCNSGGGDEDCHAEPPSSTEECREMYGCTWNVTDWGTCSQECGEGASSREVVCSSGSDADCALLERPLDQQRCSGLEGPCQWQTSTWSNCTASGCGAVGVRMRSVTCPSWAGAAGCPGLAPAAVEECQSDDLCEWQTSAWSSCDVACGTGHRFRTVWCPGPGEDLCLASGPKPILMEACEGEATGTPVCSWTVGAWSACVAEQGCGVGQRIRTVTCEDQACQEPRPAESEVCNDTSACSWLVSSWSACSMRCGAGVQNRTVRCSSGRDVDCSSAGPRPLEHQECQGSDDCLWTVGEWSVCSVACGVGSQHRSLACGSGFVEDCEAMPHPETVRVCHETSGCSWRTSEWSSCSELCGQGHQSRAVFCSSGFDSDCQEVGERPAEQQACEGSHCYWNATAWSPCSVDCGEGVQVRQVGCLSAFGCVGSAPLSEQYCTATTGCQWVASEWSQCSNQCGHGSRYREVWCSGGLAGLCADEGAKPGDIEACEDMSDCSWVVGPWSECSGAASSCGPQTREVACETGRAADCTRIPPAAARSCAEASCVGSSAEVLEFSLSLGLDLGTSDATTETLLAEVSDAIRHVVAMVLEIDSSYITVRMVDRRLQSRDHTDHEVPSPPRELQDGSVEQQFAIAVRGAGRGSLAFLQTEAGSSLLSTDLSAALHQQGVEVVNFSLSSLQVKEVEEPEVPTGNTTLEPIALAEASSSNQKGSGLVVVVLMTLFGLLAAALTLLYIHFRVKWSKPSKVAAVPLEEPEEDEGKLQQQQHPRKRIALKKIFFPARVSFTKVDQEAVSEEDQGPDRPPASGGPSPEVSESEGPSIAIPVRGVGAPAKPDSRVSPAKPAEEENLEWKPSKGSNNAERLQARHCPPPQPPPPPPPPPPAPPSGGLREVANASSRGGDHSSSLQAAVPPPHPQNDHHSN